MHHQSHTRRRRACGALALFALGLGSAIPSAAATIQTAGYHGAAKAPLARLVWNRKDFRLGDWPENLDLDCLEVLDAWRPFAEQNGYRMDLLADCRVLLLSQAQRNRSVLTWQERIEDTVALADDLIPWTEPSTAPLGVMPSEADGWRYGGDQVRVLVRLNGSEDRDALVHDLVRRSPELLDWQARGLSEPSFLLREPACAAWIESGSEAVEGAAGECVNHLTQLLLDGRFGVLPTWLEAGLGWTIENEVTGRIMSVPSLAETPRRLPVHGFQAELKKLFRHRRSVPVSGQELLQWQRSTWDANQAALAWGVCAHMVNNRPNGIANLCADLALARVSLDGVGRGDGSWNGILREEWNASEVERAIARHLGPSARSHWSSYFAAGRDFPAAR